MKCLNCNSGYFVKNGLTKRGNQRFRCKDCGKSFCLEEQPNSIVISTRLRNLIIKSLLDEKKPTISDIKKDTKAKEHELTIYYWRHKIMNELVKLQEDIKLSGEIQADEIFLPVSYKGNHLKSAFKLPRTAKKRSSDTHLRGTSKEKVAVLTALDDKGVCLAIPIAQGKPTSNQIYNALKNKIEEGSTLITDSASAYNKLAKQLKLTLIKIPSGSHSTTYNGVSYNINKINNLHMYLRKFMANFFGVSSKFLPSYVAWFAFLRRKDIDDKQKKKILTEIISTKNLKTYREMNKVDVININKSTVRKKKAKS